MGKIKSAVEMKMRPTALIANAQEPFGQWSEYDYKLVEAYLTLKDEVCSHCGNFIWQCRSIDDRVAWRVHEYTCYAEKEMQRAEDNAKKKDQRASREDRKNWGLHRATFPIVRPDMKGERLPTRREYYESLPDLDKVE